LGLGRSAAAAPRSCLPDWARCRDLAPGAGIGGFRHMSSRVNEGNSPELPRRGRFVPRRTCSIRGRDAPPRRIFRTRAGLIFATPGRPGSRRLRCPCCRGLRIKPERPWTMRSRLLPSRYHDACGRRHNSSSGPLPSGIWKKLLESTDHQGKSTNRNVGKMPARHQSRLLTHRGG